MKLLTTKQKKWLIKRKIKPGNTYPFPKWGFMAYLKPNFDNSEYIESNPFTKSLSHEFFYVKEIENGFCKGNFHINEKGNDIYIHEDELSFRGVFESFILLIITFIPLISYNMYKGGVKKIELNN